MAIKKKAVKKKAVAKKKVATKKVVAKKAVANKTVAKKAVAKAAPAAKALKTAKEAMNKTQLVTTIVEQTGVSKKDVGAVFDCLADVIGAHVKKGGAGHFTLPGLLKVKTIRKPAQKAKKNVPNPFKPGELMDVAAKPARTVVKVLPLKKLKDMVG